jgi:hypothetical protein
MVAFAPGWTPNGKDKGGVMFSYKLIFPLLVAGLVALLAAAACDEGGGGSPLDNGLPPDDTDTGTASECTEIAWGSGLTVGQPVANWTQSGYVDGTGDGVVEEEEVEFTLEDVNCDGADTIVLIIGSTT